MLLPELLPSPTACRKSRVVYFGPDCNPDRFGVHLPIMNLDRFGHAPDDDGEWLCEDCGEPVLPQLCLCWQCAEDRREKAEREEEVGRE